MSRTFFTFYVSIALAIMPSVTGCTSRSAPIATNAPSRFAELKEAAGRSDAIVIARVLTTDFSEPAADGFLSTLTVRIEQVLQGSSNSSQPVCIRVPVGQEANGQWRITAHTVLISSNPASSIKPGEQLLLFLSRSFYAEQAKARQGEPLATCTAAPFGMARVQAGTISTNHLAYESPATVKALQQVLEDVQ